MILKVESILKRAQISDNLNYHALKDGASLGNEVNPMVSKGSGKNG